MKIYELASRIVSLGFFLCLLSGCSVPWGYEGSCNENGVDDSPVIYFGGYECKEYCSSKYPDICSKDQEALPDFVTATIKGRDESTCLAYGFEIGSEAMAGCLMKQDMSRKEAEAAAELVRQQAAKASEEQAMKNLGQSLQDASKPRPIYTPSNTGYKSPPLYNPTRTIQCKTIGTNTYCN